MVFTNALKKLFTGSASESFFDDLTDALISGDVSASVAVSMVDKLMAQCKGKSFDDILEALKSMIGEAVNGIELLPEPGKTNIWMVLGVNGVGKTTTCAKIANMFCARGIEENAALVLAAADTFRAAAIEQLQMHGERIKVRVVHHQMGSDPSAVVFDAAEAVKAAGGGLVIADTAGRLHNKEGLVRELQKINKTCLNKSDSGCCKKLLVIDATTGGNAARQAQVFNEAVGVDAIVLAKSDASSKGGALVTIGHEEHISVAYECYGEGYSDIKVFNKEQFIRRFAGLD